MSTVAVKLPSNPYSIVIGHGNLADIPKVLAPLKLGRDAVIISNGVIERLHGKGLAGALKAKGYSVKFMNVPAGESSKSSIFALKLIEQIARYDVDKNVFIIALGGGVVGDLAGFVAAIYKRGIPFVQVPTTLLAQIDSSIGGKTGIDLICGKNLVGAIYQPRLVLTDTKVLKTLDVRQIRNGLAEAIKYGIIDDAALFKFIEQNHEKFLKGNPQVMTTIVKRCSQIKARVVALDERETKGIRTILNFGHTVGHAVEAAAKYNQYHHGEAIGLGMRVASRISVELGLLSKMDEARINALISAVGLPEKIKSVGLTKILNTMRHDKKFVGGKNRFVLCSSIGKVVVWQGIPMPVIIGAIKDYLI